MRRISWSLAISRRSLRRRVPRPRAALRIPAEYAPNIKNAVIARQMLSPLDLERRFGLTGGNIFHGEITPDQSFNLRPVSGYADYRTPLAGLYLCGSGAHPGGGVTGIPGHNAAQVVIGDLAG